MSGSSFSFTLAAALTLTPIAGFAAAHAERGASVSVASVDTSKNPDTAKSAGTIDGQVSAIDYRAGTMSVQAGTRKVDVVVLPSTNIQGAGNTFHTIADIKKGAHVRVLMSQRGSVFTAQLINLL